MLGVSRSLRCNSALRELSLSAPSLNGSNRDLRFFRTGHKPAHSPSDEERPPQRSVPFEWQSEVASNLWADAALTVGPLPPLPIGSNSRVPPEGRKFVIRKGHSH